MNDRERPRGSVIRIAGPVVDVTGLDEARLYDVVRVGQRKLIGEIIRLDGPVATVQVYEDTGGLRVGEGVHNTGAPFVATLGPGLLGNVYDGLQRPLTQRNEDGEIMAFLQRGMTAAPLPSEKQWSFTPQVAVGRQVEGGNVLGVIPESQVVEHRVLVPPDVCGEVTAIADGQLSGDDVVAEVQDGEGRRREITLQQKWPVRRPRPFANKHDPQRPLITGTRVIDTFFPVAQGGTAIIPGGFGTGKTVTEQSLARWSDADVVVYVGCGERGNEMAEVLSEFPELEDPRHGAPLMERTVLIANTSNMPVAAREASIYLGVTIAEYYRDMGYGVVLLADSTSRWGEALREISGRLEEMPGEEGYPAYLGARLAEFYERSGRVVCLGEGTATENDSGEEDAPRRGSVTLVGAVSPPGGDFSEPVTQNSMRVVGAFWALDHDLSRRRHFPAIDWIQSYTLYDLEQWYQENVAQEWAELTREALTLLQEEDELQEIVQLVGPDALAEEQQEILAVARMIREDFLQQSAFHEIDRFCTLPKAYWMLRTILHFHHRAVQALEDGTPLDRIMALSAVSQIARMKEIANEEAPEQLQALMETIDQELRP